MGEFSGDGRGMRAVPYKERPLTFDMHKGCVWICMLDLYCPLSDSEIASIKKALKDAQEGVYCRDPQRTTGRQSAASPQGHE